MQYVITFLEGLISFISPCMLPLLPVYISYFAGDANKKHRTLTRALGFVIGFTAVFTSMGLFAGTLGGWLMRYNKVVNIICGVIVILLGISYIKGAELMLLGRGGRKVAVNGFFSSVMFGAVYSVTLTPCVGVFLGSALMMASTAGSSAKGAALLLVYSLGLGVPFLISAVLIEKLNSAFAAIKRNYGIINTVCGIFLIFIGVMMAFGLMNRFMGMFM